MSSGPSSPRRLSRRKWAVLVAAAPVAAQVTTVPPQGSPAPAAPGSTPEAKLQKAYADVRAVSERLAQIEVPLDVEPAFSFKA